MKRAICAMTLAVVCVGCSKPTAPLVPTGIRETPSALSATQDEFASSSNKFHVVTSVSANPRTLVRGNSALIVVSVTNRAKQVVTLGFATACQLTFKVYDSSGTYLGPGSACAEIPTYLRLSPRQTVSQTFEWGGSLPAGRYLVYASVGSLPRGRPSRLKVVEP